MQRFDINKACNGVQLVELAMRLGHTFSINTASTAYRPLKLDTLTSYEALIR